MRIRDKDEDISHMLTKVTRRRAVEYQVTMTRGGWCRLRDLIPKVIAMFAIKHGIHAANSYCTPQK
jgi:RNA:NAD 2'-phosphotransferase (TPT1/KptA family)